MGLDFTSKSTRTEPADPPTTITFRLDKQPFKCVLRTDADSVLEWSEMAAAADDTDVESPAGAAFVARFFKLMMPPDQYRGFRAHLKKQETDPDVLIEIMQAINNEMEAQVEKNTSRPTGQSSRSSGGRAATGERTAKIISLAAADGEIELVSEERKPTTRNQRRKQARRRAG